jgi:hypothetical protein
MALQCNIDAKGKVARLIWGVMVLIGGFATLFFWALSGGGWAAWVVTGVLMAVGAFGIFEARTGWCVVRAMGVKTRF